MSEKLGVVGATGTRGMRAMERERSGADARASRVGVSRSDASSASRSAVVGAAALAKSVTMVAALTAIAVAEWS
eukprot:1515249-Alexandrium_andersonii.AAC.1